MRTPKLQVGDLVIDSSDGLILIVQRVSYYPFGLQILCRSVEDNQRLYYDKYNIHYLKKVEQQHDETILWKTWGDQ